MSLLLETLVLNGRWYPTMSVWIKDIFSLQQCSIILHAQKIEHVHGRNVPIQERTENDILGKISIPLEQYLCREKVRLSYKIDHLRILQMHGKG